MANNVQHGSSFFGVVSFVMLLLLGVPGVFGSDLANRIIAHDTTDAELIPPSLPELEPMPRVELLLTPDVEIVTPDVEIVTPPPPAEFIGPGEASYYHDALNGNPTASGESYNPGALTAAHRTLPLGTRVRVTNQRNGKAVVVRINDRGPFVDGRVIDLSFAAARSLGMVRRGVADVHLHLLEE